jgi:DNA mismatch endonuclease (patch repair protein)
VDEVNPIKKIAIFVDGDYWHANPIKYSPDHILGKNRIAKNIWKRDKRITKFLTDKGYRVFRFWESDLKKDIQGCVNKIKIAYEDRA